MRSAICCVTIHSPQVEIMENIFKQYNIDAEAYYCKFEDLVVFAKKLVQNGAKIIAARGIATIIIKETVSIPVVDMEYTYFDYINPVKRAYKKSKNIVVLTWQNKKFIKYFPITDRLEYLEFKDSLLTNFEAQLEIKMKKMMDTEGVEVFIGGANVVKIAKKLDAEYEYVGLNKDVILESVKVAYYYANIFDEKEKNYRFFDFMMNSVSEGAIAINYEFRVINMNMRARKILGLDVNLSYQNLLVKDFIDDSDIIDAIRCDRVISNKIININGVKIILNSTPVNKDGTHFGSVITLHEVENIKNLENKIRINSIQSGYYAKKNFSDIIGSSTVISETRELAKKFALSKSTILIQGETGTGKELFAQSIHNASSRKYAPFVAINCAALPESVLESELFGYVRGAFTGAKTEGKAGLFEMAYNGTIFLDEIGDVSLKMQTRLLRVLQEKEVSRIGDDKIIPINARIIAATNKDLKKEVELGTFREDLYYRLCVLELFIPALRERKEDLLDIIQSLMISGGSIGRKFTPDAMDVIRHHEWRGNVRELSNFVERICVSSSEETIDKNIVCKALGVREMDPVYKINTELRSCMVDGEYILKILKECKDNKRETARRLGISKTTLWRRLKELGIE